MEKKGHIIEGKSWVYNTYEDWQKQFPFWSVTTIRRTLKGLEKQGLLLTDNFSVMAFDRTKWYTIDYVMIESMTSPCDHIDRTKEPDQTDDMTTPATPITESNEQKTSTGDHSLSERETFEKSLGKDKVQEAIDIAKSKGINAWAYIRKILLNWQNDQLRTKKPARKEKLPDWFGKEAVPTVCDADFKKDRASFLLELSGFKEEVDDVNGTDLI
jgi:DnaD/phage-associated family protein